MKALIAALALSVALGATAQDNQQMMSPTPPKELKGIGFMLGEFNIDMKMYAPGQSAPMDLKGTIVTKAALGGMWLQSSYDSTIAGMPMLGLQMTTFDESKKDYVAYWFDSMGAQGLEMHGKLVGQTLTLLSKPETVPGMPGKQTFRAVTSLKGPGKILFRLETTSGKGWSKVIEGYMTKK